MKAEAGAFYRPELDALRFAAFLAVFWFHRMDYEPAARNWGLLVGTIGAFGVPVFFLLSAFLIAELLLRERERTGRVHAGAFYIRRMLRIWPLYFAAFFGLALLERVLPGVGSRAPGAWAAFTFFCGNWWITRHGWIAGATDPLWSISVEEQFYLAVPWLVWFGGRRALGWVAGLLPAVSLATVVWYARHDAPGDHGEWTNSLVQLQFFGAGALLALCLRGRAPSFGRLGRAAAAGLGFLCWAAALLFCRVRSWDPHPSPGQAFAGWALVLTGAVLFFLAALGMPGRWVPGWLRYLGRISYGLYVFHSLLFFLVFERAGVRGWSGTLVVLALSIGAAHLSFRYFERPFLRLKARFTFVAVREEAAR